MNRRAEFGAFDLARKSVYWMIASFFLALLLLAYFLLIGGYKERITHIPAPTEAEMISLRFTQIAECFAYQDPLTHRVFPGVLDLGKFTSQQLASCYPGAGVEDFGFAFSLENGRQSLATENYHTSSFPPWRRDVIVDHAGQRSSDVFLIMVDVPGGIS